MTLQELLTDYKEKGLAIPAFNIDCFETFQALEEVILECKTPVIAQLSPNELEFIKPERLMALTRLLSDQDLPIFLNVDHGRDLDVLKEVIDLGFDMVHFDGSKLTLENNLELTKGIVDYAHQNGVLVEVEIDNIKETGEALTQKNFTNPKVAADFIKKTRADILAIAVGNTHGAPKEGCFEQVDLTLLEEIQSTLPETFLTMHGGSGIKPEDLKTAIQKGIVKININTDLRLAFRSHLETVLNSNDSIKAYHLLATPVQAIKDKMKEKLDLFSKNV